MELLSLFKSKKEKRLREAALENRDAMFALTLSQMATGAKSLGSLNVSAMSMLNVAAIFASIRIRGENLANLPLRIIRKKGREKVESPNERLRTLLQDSPDGQITATQWIQTMESHSCLTGCAYSYIERNIYGEPVRILQVPSYNVSYWERDWNTPQQRLEYNVNGQRVSSHDLIIFPFAQVFPYWAIMRPAQILNTPIALAQALDNEAYNLLARGCSASGILQTDAELSENARARTLEYIKSFRDGAKNSGSFMLLENGLKYLASRMTNKDAEFVELKKQSILDAYAIWGVPSYLLGDGTKANYSSQEEANRNFLYNTMMARAKLFQNELNNKLLTPEERAEGDMIDFDLRGILQGSMRDRAEYYTKLYYMGAITIDTICEMEDLPLLGGELGEMRFVQQNLQPIDNLKKQNTTQKIEEVISE